MLAHNVICFVACIGLLVAGYDVQDAKVRMPGSLGLTLHVYAPSSPEGTNSFPVIWFATGFGCATPVSLYSKLLSGIVSKGYIVAGLYHAFPHVPAYMADGHHMHDIMEWGKHYLAAAMADAKLNAVPDVLGRSAVMGQSAGCHVAGQALTDGCSIAKAFIMIDPVDGFDPYRIVKSQDLIKPGEKVKFTIPALLLDNGLDPLKVNFLYPPCAPSEVSNDHFYNAWEGPIWNINATAYGHVDCTDYPNGFVCPYNRTTDKDLYRDMLAEAITTFLGALFDNQPAQFSLLENASHWKVGVVLKHDLKGKKYSDIKAGCVNKNMASSVVV